MQKNTPNYIVGSQLKYYVVAWIWSEDGWRVARWLIRVGDTCLRLHGVWKKLKEGRLMAEEVDHDREDAWKISQGQTMSWSARTSYGGRVDSDSDEELPTVVSPWRSVVMGPVESSRGDPFIMWALVWKLRLYFRSCCEIFCSNEGFISCCCWCALLCSNAWLCELLCSKEGLIPLL